MVDPRCPYFGTCGGCSTQHVAYEDQRANKHKQLTQLLDFPEVTIIFDEPYLYRNRMDFVFHPSGIGLRKKGTWHTVVAIDECVIANTRIHELATEVRKFFSSVDAFHLQKHTGTFRYVVIRAPSCDSSLSFVLNSDSMNIADAVSRIEEFSLQTSATHVLITYVTSQSDVSVSDDYRVVKGSDVLCETFLGKTFYFPVQGFFQNNSSVMGKLHHYVHSLLQTYDTSSLTLIDLYGGVGCFGIINHSLFHDVVIVESVTPAISCAQRNIAENSCANVRALCLDAAKISQLSVLCGTIVITDPPRTGMHPRTIRYLLELKPRVLVYVSCNMKQMIKDMKYFTEYRIVRAAVFDLFPQTNHAEAVVVYELR